jgi:hypothetical protein
MLTESKGGQEWEKKSLKIHGILWVMHLASISKQNKGGGYTLPTKLGCRNKQT